MEAEEADNENVRAEAGGDDDDDDSGCRYISGFQEFNREVFFGDHIGLAI